MAWLLALKLEMTRIIKWTDFVPVTLLKIPTIKVVHIKRVETDWYNALVLWVLKNDKEEVFLSEWKKSLNLKKFRIIREVPLSDDELSKFNVWDVIDLNFLDWVENVELTWFSKWKWFTWAMKRYNFRWWRASHGSKFHRALWSIGTRKPRRTHKWKKMHWHMWNVKITLKKVPVELINKDLWVIGVKWPVPWARNSLVVLKF